MLIIKIKVSYGLTINKGNYESERIDVTVEHDIVSDELLPVGAADIIFNKLKNYVWKKGGKL